MLKIAYSGKSKPGALAIAENLDNVDLIRGSAEEVDINWGRNKANSSLNPDISNATNKRIMCELFREHNVPAPELYVSQENDDLRAIQLPAVGRPDNHTKGRGFWLCKTESDILLALKGTRKKKPATHFMQLIDKEVAPREYRVHIFLGKSIRISEKDFDDNGKYTTAKPQHKVKHVRAAAKEAVKALGLDFGAVDIMANDEECWVLEVNTAPGLGGSMPRLYADVFERWSRGEWD